MSDEKSYNSKLRSHQSKNDLSYENHDLYYSDANVLHETEIEQADPFSVLEQTSQISPTMVKSIISPDEEDHRNLERYSPDNPQLLCQPHGQMDATMASLFQLMQQQLQLTQQQLQLTQQQLLQQQEQTRQQQEQLKEQQEQTRQLTKKRAESKNQRPPPLPPICGDKYLQEELTRFEQHMTTYEIPKARWPAELRPILKNDAFLAFIAIPPSDSANYDAIKTALLVRAGVSPTARIQTLLAMEQKNDQTAAQVYGKILDTLRDFATDMTLDKCFLENLALEIVYRQVQPHYGGTGPLFILLSSFPLFLLHCVPLYVCRLCINYQDPRTKLLGVGALHMLLLTFISHL